jgi:ribosome biogenesis protein ERB1
VRAIRRGWIKRREEREEEKKPPVYMLWEDDSALESARTGAGLSYIAAPKPDLPGHEESYHPPPEFLPSEADRKAAAEAVEAGEEPPWLAQSFDALRKVPQYAAIVHERFERCLDLYLCPRVRSRKIHYKPEDLVPKELPKPGDLRPYPNTLSITYCGHRSKVRGISAERLYCELVIEVLSCACYAYGHVRALAL